MISILKTTFLFSAVKIIQIVIGIVRNKFIAVYLGAEGIGLIGIFQSSMDLLVSGAGLGISKSAVRDISSSLNSGDFRKYNFIIAISKKLYLLTAVAGLILTIFLNKTLSNYTLGKSNFTIDYLLLSIVVFLNILAEGQVAIVTGARKMLYLAKMSIIGSIMGLITSIPLFWYFGVTAIVPSLIISSLSAFIISNYYVSKIGSQEIQVKLKEIFIYGKPIIKMGFSLMLVSFYGLLFNFFLVAYLQRSGGMEIVGLYKAGMTVVLTYFGVVLTAMTTDYFPRISAVHDDISKVLDETNKQSEVGLLLVAPIALIFIQFSPFFFKYFYSDEFLLAVEFTNISILGVLLMTVSNCLGMIFIAKRDSKFFTTYSFSHRIVFLVIYILFFKYFSLKGLGYSFLIDVIVQFVFYYIFLIRRHNIVLGNNVIRLLSLSFVMVLTAIIATSLFKGIVSNILGIMLIFFSLFRSITGIKKINKM